MKEVLFKGKPTHIEGALPDIGTSFPKEMTLTYKNLKEGSLSDFLGKKIVINVFPSIDTGVCQNTVRTFFKDLSKHPEIILINISNDTPFALERFCATEGIDTAINFSAFRSTFGKESGTLILDGPLKGFLARSVLVLDEKGVILYKEQIEDISEEPNYEKAIEAALKK